MRCKLLLLLCVAFALLPGRASAQRYEVTDSTGTYYINFVPHKQQKAKVIKRWDNDFRLSVGAPGIIQSLLLDTEPTTPEPSYTYTSASDRLFDARTYKAPTRFTIPISLEYGHYIRDWFIIGAKSSLSCLYGSVRHIETNELIERSNYYTLSAICNLRFEYMRREIVRLYSGIGLGLVVGFNKDYRIALPMFDITYIGITIGRDLYGFAEFGGGMSGSLRCGLGYRF